MNYKDLQEYADLNDKQIEKFKTYFDLLIEWNNKINLTSIVEENEVITKHFADSLSILKYPLLNHHYFVYLIHFQNM